MSSRFSRITLFSFSDISLGNGAAMIVLLVKNFSQNYNDTCHFYIYGNILNGIVIDMKSPIQIFLVQYLYQAVMLL